MNAIPGFKYYLTIMLSILGACKTAEPTNQGEIVAIESPIAPNHVDANAEVALTEPKIVVDQAPSEDCAVEIKCPPQVAPVRCSAVEIGGGMTYEIDSAPNHCAGMSRLATKICLAGRKFSDFFSTCELKSR
jgi:hypothetical protein